ncbi:hypothetical protein Tco_0629210 [Tanacetum coccineum]|uniref:Uncharacterized protein n=1 Tax=Tanacetum coccineum TaxID=301880 RepID=A0ABQ4WST6_9ASTR
MPSTPGEENREVELVCDNPEVGNMALPMVVDNCGGLLILFLDIVTINVDIAVADNFWTGAGSLVLSYRNQALNHSILEAFNRKSLPPAAEFNNLVSCRILGISRNVSILNPIAENAMMRDPLRRSLNGPMLS